MISPKILLSQQNRAFGITTSGYLVQRTFVFLFLYDVCGGGCVSRYGNCMGERCFCTWIVAGNGLFHSSVVH